MAEEVAICTICSRAKDPIEELLPAHSRYLGSHIAKVALEAAQLEVPFYILSGVYGLIGGDRLIPYYERSLKRDRVGLLGEIISDQLKRIGAKRMYAYIKRKPEWKPYLDALQIGCKRQGVILEVHELDDDA